MTLKIMAIMAKIFLKYGHNMATFLMNFDPIFSFYCIFMWQFFSKISNLERNFTNCFYKNFQSENLKILRWKLLEEFVLCHKILWMLNWKLKFGQNGPKNIQKWPEISKFSAKAKYGHICHENCGHISKNSMAKAIWNMATLAIYGHSWEHWKLCALLKINWFSSPN